MNKIGAGVYIPTRGDGHACTQAREVTVNPGGHQSTNTINRAELSGIWAALHLKELEIATDSATSLSQLRKALLSPMDLRYHKHREMAGHVIQLIREILAEDPDIQITIYKIKAHNGRIGNECADRTAKRATNISNQNKFDLNCPITDKPSFAKSYWLRRASKDQPGRTEYLENLGKSLHDHMHERNHLGNSNTESIYFKSWQQIRPHTDTEISNRLINHPNISIGARRVALMYRHGSLWNNKIASRCHMSKSTNCPLCGQLDGVSHIAGGCQHNTMERMYTARHNSTGRLLMRAISKGDLGTDMVMADLGSAEKCDMDGAPVLPRCPKELEPFLRKTDGSKGSRPDAIILHKSEDGIKDTIYIIEFKYCKDTKPEDQLEKCKTQHSTLIDDLKKSGYTVELVPILIGHSGTIYTSHTLNNMKQLGISNYHARKCALKMHVDAINHLHSIVKTRRHLEPNTDPTRKPSRQKAKFNTKGMHFKPP